ncbi:ABC transporter ATP-binding protein [Gemella sp. zg-1178]|uniref:ABC transporter ATP-binding protein n=1 Tax=Gemella sp. zg-1178 TaxID=2840372 RepID=UPI001C05CE6D|nr:ABC transporter ATP-binding protein [Gemella sp. zg-1178]MBU0278210.1 ABC transporter ATP-binding protein/permease [Gemella sp. zg-1178]
MFKLLKKLTKTELLFVLISVAFVCANVWLELEIPAFMSEITTLLGTPGTSANDIFSFSIHSPGMKMLYYSLLSFIASVVVGFFSSRVAASFTSRIRSEIFHNILDYSETEIKKFGIPSLLTRSTNDITQIQILITIGLQVVTKGPIMAIWAMTKIAGKGVVEWMWATAVAVAFLVFVIAILLTLVFPKQRIIQKMTDNLNLITRESLTGIRVVRAYNAEGYQEEKFQKTNDDVTRLNLFVTRILSVMNPVMLSISSGLTLAIYWIGAFLINDIKIPQDPSKIEPAMREKLAIFSDMIVFSSYAMLVVIGFMLMLVVFMILPRAIVSAKRINEVLETTSSIKFNKNTQKHSQEKATVEFNNVSFRYSESSEAVLENVSFRAEKSQTVAFIGSTGSGKSTLINLVPRFYDATSGQIKINGNDIKNYSKEDLHNIIGYIPQKAVLFSGSVKSNIQMGTSKQENLSDEAIWATLELAQSKNFVEAKEDGLNAHVAQGGTNFSGGQRQRLAIARALARKPEILIFDDSFSALDYKTDKILREQLKEKTKDTTKLIVAQRISTIIDADLIIVLEEGRVVGRGTHEELLKTNKVYQEIAYSQLSKEELEHEKK